MLPLKKLSRVLLVGVIFLTACSSAGGTPANSATITPIALPTATRVPPIPSLPGDSILWDDLQVTLDQLEITQEYLTDFGSTRNPPAGRKFLWVHIRLKNTSQTEMGVPAFEHYSILYAGTEIKPVYGHRDGYLDYVTFRPVIFPDQELAGWLRFDIPSTAELKEMLFVFIPESAQIGVSFSSPNYPYADNKPTYVWKCAR
jgi:hypothetical protein